MLREGSKRDFVREFLNYIQVEKGLSRNTLQSYARDIAKLQQWAAQNRKPIEKLERKLEQHQADLTHIDGVLRLFQPDRDPAEIKPKRAYARRTRYFARNELSRLVMEVLRAADGPLRTTDEIAGAVIEAKGFDAADAALRASIRDQVLTLLRSLRKQGTVEQIGLGRGVRWKLPNGA